VEMVASCWRWSAKLRWAGGGERGGLILGSDHNFVQGFPKRGPRTPELVSFHFNERNITSLQSFFGNFISREYVQKTQLITFFKESIQ